MTKRLFKFIKYLDIILTISCLIEQYWYICQTKLVKSSESLMGYDLAESLSKFVSINFFLWKKQLKKRVKVDVGDVVV